MVEAQHLRFRYKERPALNGLSFSVPAGALFAVLGPNGSGKSTLFQVLATVRPIQEGSASIDGRDLRLNPRLARLHLGVVFQASSLDQRLTAEENLLAQGALYGLSGSFLRHRVSEVLEQTHLAARRNDRASSLSGGLRRKLEIAKALIHRPRVLLLDEASAGLDPRARVELLELLQQLRRDEGLTTVYTTHLMDEADHATELLMMHQGRAALMGTPAELKQSLSGDIVIFRHPVEGLGERLLSALGSPTLSGGDGELRVEVPDGPRFVAQAFDAFPGAAEAVEIHKPTLEDVFFRATGAEFHA